MVNTKFEPDEWDLEILAAMRAAPALLSGQALADRLGISRVAVWKRIKRLRGLNYRVQGGHGGYRLLEEDAVGPWEFQDGDTVVYRTATTSTMDEAWALAEGGAASGTLVIADRQSAGRGRQGGAWLGPGGSVSLTLILRPSLPASHAGGMVLEAACALAEWLEARPDSASRPLSCQWPHELLVDGRKVGGLLVELAGTPEAPRFFLLGLGLDLRAMDLPDAGETSAGPPLRRDLAAAFRKHMAAWAESPRLRPADWARRCPQMGRPAVLQDWQGQRLAGIVRGFTAQGGLILADPATGGETLLAPAEVMAIGPAEPSIPPAEPALPPAEPPLPPAEPSRTPSGDVP
jgi:BirA family biotin operon repressor/biotin-[acetyl-CoA-carboxylase] ligase